MALSVGIGRHWFHDNHYDIPQGRVTDIMAKSVIVSSKVIVDIIRGRYEQTI